MFPVDTCYSCNQGIPTFFQVTYWPKALSVVMYSYNLDAYWARRSSNTQMQILYDIKDLDENSTSESSTGSTR